jgi:hypothetical protein
MEALMKVFIKNLSHKFSWLFVATIFLGQFAFGAKDQFVRVVNDDANYFKTKLDFQIPNNKNCQTLTYLNRPSLRKNVEADYSHKINLIGKDFFENLINTIIEKELELKEDYYVFYHGKKLEWLLFDDILDALNKILLKKSMKDFFLLRIPDKDHKMFKSVSEFLKYYKENGLINDWDFDHKTQIQKLLISVNPSLFGNNYNLGECTFYYFLNSTNAESPDIEPLIKKIFEHFKIVTLYNKYENQIKNLFQLLKTNDQAKTGVLMQFFIPKNIINDVAYRCIEFGNLYYSNPEFHPASIDADRYQNDSFFSTEAISSEFDKMQFRLLINEKLLNPNSKIKIFRYYKETGPVKTYKRELESLISQINTDVLKKAPKLWKRR